MLTNAEIGELLLLAARDEPGHRRRALERASRAARFWPEEASELAETGRSSTELRAVGRGEDPGVARRATPATRARRDATGLPHLRRGPADARCRPSMGSRSVR